MIFIDLTHRGSQRTVSFRIDSIDVIDHDRDGSTVKVGNMTVLVEESRQEIMQMIKDAKNNKQNEEYENG